MMRDDIQAYILWRGEFDAVLDPLLWSIEWLDNEIAGKRAHFLATDKAAIVYEFRQYPTGNRDLHGLIAAGEANEIINVLIPEAERIGRDNACIGAVIESRAGWQRVLKDHGYSLHQTSIRKVL